MAIYAYTGLPGHGKSYSVVQFQVLPALRAGRQVVTNLPLKVDLLREAYPSAPQPVLFDTQELMVSPDRISELGVPGCVFILDEAWRLFPAGVRADKVPEPFRSFFAEHRHRVNDAGDSTQIVIVTQDLAQVASFVRQLVEETFRMVKLNHVGLSKRFRVDVYNGPAAGPNPPVSQRIRQMPGRYDSRVYRFYLSHTQSQSGSEGANEKTIDARANVLRRPVIIAAPFVIVGLFGFFWWHVHTYGLIAGYGAHVRPPLVPVRSGSSPGGRPVFVDTSRWRVSGVVSGLCFQGRCGWAVLQRGGRSRLVSLSRCRQVALSWSCPSPDGPVARFVSAPRAVSRTRSASF